MRHAKTVAGVARASACVLASLLLSGCATVLTPEALAPDAEPGSDHYEGYLAGVQFADDAWHQVGAAAAWLDQHSLRATDLAVRDALLELPSGIVESRSSAWVEAFRAGASDRFWQCRVYAYRRRETAERGCVLTALGVAAAAGLMCLAIMYMAAMQDP